MRTVTVKSEKITANTSVILVETNKNYLLKIRFKEKNFTIDRFRKEELQNALFYFRKTTERLKESVKRSPDSLAIIQFLP